MEIRVSAVAVLACLAALASYLYVRYADVVRFSAEHGRITVDAAPAGKLGTVPPAVVPTTSATRRGRPGWTKFVRVEVKQNRPLKHGESTSQPLRLPLPWSG